MRIVQKDNPLPAQRNGVDQGRGVGHLHHCGRQVLVRVEHIHHCIAEPHQLSCVRDDQRSVAVGDRDCLLGTRNHFGHIRRHVRRLHIFAVGLIGRNVQHNRLHRHLLAVVLGKPDEAAVVIHVCV